jgi:hypothetical protein
MIPKAIAEIEFADLQALVGLVREGKMLEFKRELPSKGGAQKLVAGTSALANTAGGDFVIGIVEQGGLATAVPGIEVDDVDIYKGQLEQVMSSLIEPRLPRVDVHPVACGDGRWCFVVRVVQSWVGPHRVTSDNKFYARNSTSTYPMDVSEIRTAFGLREGVVERIERFRDERLARIVGGNASVLLKSEATVVLHMASLPSFANRDLVDVFAKFENGTQMILPLAGVSGGNVARFNLYGLVNLVGDSLKGVDSYGQLFRSGAIEGVDCMMSDRSGPYFESIAFANMIVGAVKNNLATLRAFDIGFPVFVMLSFCNARGVRMKVMQQQPGMGDFFGNPLTDQVVTFPEIQIEGPDVDVPTALRPLLNIVWNAFGLPVCDMYNQTGGWKGTA